MSDLPEFLLTTGRTLAQMTLYDSDHPAVKGAIQESHRLLTEILAHTPELTLSLHEKKLLVNGHPEENVPEASLRPFVVLLNNFGLHSLTFYQGLLLQELIPFFNLASKGDAKKLGMDIGAYLESSSVVHLRVNLAKYAKIGEDETIGGQEGVVGEGEEDLIKSLSEMSLSDLLTHLVERAIPDAQGRQKILNRALELVKDQIQAAVKRAAAEYAAEKIRVTNERERTESVINTVADGVVVIDENGKVLMMNPTAESIYGIKLGECVGKPLWEGVRKEQMVALAKDLSIPSDRPITKEVQVEADSETKQILRASSATVQDISGRVVGMVSVLSDVTKHKELQRLQNEFMANVTHDLRTPIHALKLAVAAILEGAAGPVSQEQSKMLSLANRNVERLSRLIDDLLDFSQVEAGIMRIKPQVIELNPILHDAMQSLEAWSKSRGVVLVYEENTDLPPVFADSDRLLQVINNLVANAIKFTPSSGHVTVRAKQIKERGRLMVQVDVEDTGKGISKDDQARIFERFVQLKNAEKLDVRGTGLGLSICKAIVELHKGQLFLQSPLPGHTGGSVFSFTLPSVQKSNESVVRPVAATSPEPARRNFWSRIFSHFKPLLILALFVPGAVEARPTWGTVRRVLEGDLIQLQDGTKVRYLGIDAPDKGSPYFQEALSANKRLVKNKEAVFRYSLRDRDAQGVWMAYVTVDGRFINEVLVKQGFALVTPLNNDEHILPTLIRAERDASRKKRGVWKHSAIEPYSIRAQQKTPFSWGAAPPDPSTPDQP